MWKFRPPWHSVPSLIGVVALLMASALAVSAQGQADDPVEKLRQDLPGSTSLENNPIALNYRKDILEKDIAALKTVNELRRAVALPGWKDNDLYTTPKTAAIDQGIRTKVGQRLIASLQKVAETGSEESKIAVATMIGEIGTTVRALNPRDPSGFGRDLAPVLVDMLKSSGPRVRQEAVRALGKVNPDPAAAGKAIEDLLTSKLVADRQAAALALGDMVDTSFQLYRKGVAQTGVEARPEDVVAISKEAVRVAGGGLQDADAGVRRGSLNALFQVASALFNMTRGDPDLLEKLPPPGRKWTAEEKKKVESARKLIEAEDNMLEPLLELISKQGSVLAARLTDPSVEARILARRTLEMLGGARLRILRRRNSIPVQEDEPPPEARPDLLAKAIEPGLHVIAKRALDPGNVEVRRAALDFLEALENGAAPAVPTLVKALSDPDRFIRWQAARTLGKVGPVRADLSVPALAGLLYPAEDPDVREAAANALRNFGPAGRAALPALAATVNIPRIGDSAPSEAAMRAIVSVSGGAGVEALPALRQALKSPNASLRKAAAESLGAFGSYAMPALDDLRSRLNDEDGGVRTAASEAVLNILAAGQK